MAGGPDRRAADLPAALHSARYSPDGQRLAIRVDGANGQLWLFDRARETLTRIHRRWDADFPAWSPDGERLVYVLAKGGSSDIVEMAADGTGEPRVLWSGENLNYPQWAPDGAVPSGSAAAEPLGSPRRYSMRN